MKRLICTTKNNNFYLIISFDRENVSDYIYGISN